MIPRPEIPRPRGIRGEILRGQRLLEYYCQPQQPFSRHRWSYLLLVECYDESWNKSGAGVIVKNGSTLMQTLAFSAEEIGELRQRLEKMTLPVKIEGGFALDGVNAIVRIRDDGSCMDLSWSGCEPEEWAPLHEWINDVWQRIEDKAFDEDFDTKKTDP